jgi:hypothetical protein
MGESLLFLKKFSSIASAIAFTCVGLSPEQIIK